MSALELPPRCDVAIVGAGPAGTAVALALARLAPGRSVALIDAGARQRPLHDEFLAAEARPLLEQLECWEGGVAERIAPAAGTLAAWGDAELSSRPSLFAADGSGWRIDRADYAELLVRAAESRGVAVAREARLAEIEGAYQDERQWRLEIVREDRSSTLTTRFLVDATGRQAHVARRLGAKKVRFDRLVGVFVAFAAEPSDVADGSGRWDALVEASEPGVWYCAHAPDQTVVAFMTDADLARESGVGDETTWHRLFRASAVSTELGPSLCRKPGGPPTVRAVDSHRLDHVAGPGWLAAGDAAASSDFLASRGLHQAIDTGMRAASAVLDELAGRPTGRHRYQRALENKFEELLRLRAEVYSRESRFSSGTFWRRRQDRVTLEPHQMVAFTESADHRSRLEGLGMHLPSDQLQQLCSLCVAPRLVHAVVGAFKESYAAPGSSPPSDRRILLALQYLVEQGLVTAE